MNGGRCLAVRFQIIGVRLYFRIVDVREPANAQAFEIVRRLMEPVLIIFSGLVADLHGVAILVSSMAVDKHIRRVYHLMKEAPAFLSSHIENSFLSDGRTSPHDFAPSGAGDFDPPFRSTDCAAFLNILFLTPPDKPARGKD